MDAQVALKLAFSQFLSLVWALGHLTLGQLTKQCNLDWRSSLENNSVNLIQRTTLVDEMTPQTFKNP